MTRQIGSTWSWNLLLYVRASAIVRKKDCISDLVVIQFVTVADDIIVILGGVYCLVSDK